MQLQFIKLSSILLLLLSFSVYANDVTVTVITSEGGTFNVLQDGEDNDVDFRTLGDNQLGKEKYEYPWQTPATIAHSWGYNSRQDKWKSTSTILKSMIGNVSLNGNLMLNIGPRADGSLPYEALSRLNDLGDWLKKKWKFNLWK